METFEIHITGEEGINAELDALGIKNIVVDLLKPNGEVLRTEYMSSFISKHNSLIECKEMVADLLLKLKTKLIRIKIESPYYEKYVEKSLYMECHFEPTNTYSLPVSRNAKSKKLMATDRTYHHDRYDLFINFYKSTGADIELCLHDTFVNEDKDWFDLYI
jgi:hypothetical protein